MDQSAALRESARRLGFDALGIAPAQIPSGAEHLQEWLSLSYQGEMNWMSKKDKQMNFKRKFSELNKIDKLVHEPIHFKVEVDQNKINPKIKAENDSGIIVSKIIFLIFVEKKNSSADIKKIESDIKTILNTKFIRDMYL